MTWLRLTRSPSRLLHWSRPAVGVAALIALSLVLVVSPSGAQASGADEHVYDVHHALSRLATPDTCASNSPQAVSTHAEGSTGGQDYVYDPAINLVGTSALPVAGFVATNATDPAGSLYHYTLAQSAAVPGLGF